MEWLVYLSEARVAAASIDAAEIYLSARKRNRELDLTGYLHRENGCFLQYVEGPAKSLDALLLGLRRDWRHHNMRIVGRGPLSARRFPDWDMAFSETPKASFAMWLGAPPKECPPAQALAQANSDQALAFFESLRGQG